MTVLLTDPPAVAAVAASAATAASSPSPASPSSATALPPVPLLSVTRIPNKGRAFVATRDIPPATLLLRALPYAAVPDSASRARVCAGCLAETDAEDGPAAAAIRLRPCRGGCGRAYYCSSRPCEEDDARRGHAAGECAFLRELFAGPADPLGLGSYTLDFMWLILRVLTLRWLEQKTAASSPHRPARAAGAAAAGDDRSPAAEHDPHGDPTRAAAPTFEDLWLLCSNRSAFPVKTQREFYTVARVLRRYLRDALGVEDPRTFLPPLTQADDRRPANASAQELGLDSDDELAVLDPLVALICKEECNSFGLYSFRRLGPQSARQGYALALYIEPVFFNHSCAPLVGHFVPSDVVAAKRPKDAVRGYGSEPGRAVPDSGGSVASKTAGPPLSQPSPPAGTAAPRNGQIDKPLLFYSLKPIKRDEEVTISYISLTGPHLHRNKRMQDLSEIFFFDCDCPRCRRGGSAEQDSAAAAAAATPDENSTVTGQCREPLCNGWYVPRTMVDGAEKPGSDGDPGKLEGDVEWPWMCEACGTGRRSI